MRRGRAARRMGEGWRAGERRQLRRILYICIAVSCVAHLAALFIITPPWARKAAPPRPVGGKSISIRLRPRPAGGAPAAPKARAAATPAAPKPVRAKPEEKPVRRARAYRPEELVRALKDAVSPAEMEKAARTKEESLKDTLAEREAVARGWVSGEIKAADADAERAEEGTVGYERVIDLRQCSDFELGRLMARFKMEVGYGGRKVSDFNLRFTSKWLLTPGQYRNLISSAGVGVRGGRPAAIPAGASVVELVEPADGPPAAYISPTIAAMAAIISAEEEYISLSKADPDRLERLVFRPVWTFRGPSFAVASAVARQQAREAMTPAAGVAAGEKGKGVAR